MIDINFFDDPSKAPKAREDVRFNQIALYIHPDGSRRVAIGFDITPFIERPSIEVLVTNASGKPAGSLTVIETLDTNFYLTLHLRDKEPTETYEVRARLYYLMPDDERMTVDNKLAQIDMAQAGTEIRIT